MDLESTWARPSTVLAQNTDPNTRNLGTIKKITSSWQNWGHDFVSKTSFLNEVTQIFKYSRPSLYLADVRLHLFI